MSFRDEVFKLFSEGKTSGSPEVKGLAKRTGHRGSYIYTLNWEWKKLGKPDHYPIKPRKELKATEGLVTGFAGTLAEPRREAEVLDEQHQEKQEGEEQQKEEQQKEEQREEVVKETEEKTAKITPAFGEAERETFPGMKVAGETLPFKVNLSVKTIAIYERVATEAGNGMSLGMFLDMVSEDYVIGRGVDLGWVEIRRQNG